MWLQEDTGQTENQRRKQYISYWLHLHTLSMCTSTTYMHFIVIAEVSLYGVDGSPVRGSEERWGRVKRLPGTRKQPLHPVCLSLEDSQCKDIADIAWDKGREWLISAGHCFLPPIPSWPGISRSSLSRLCPWSGGPRVHFIRFIINGGFAITGRNAEVTSLGYLMSKATRAT